MSDHLERTGGLRVVCKPFDIDHLLREVAEALDGESPGQDPTPRGAA